MRSESASGSGVLAGTLEAGTVLQEWPEVLSLESPELPWCSHCGTDLKLELPGLLGRGEASAEDGSPTAQPAPPTSPPLVPARSSEAVKAAGGNADKGGPDHTAQTDAAVDEHLKDEGVDSLGLHQQSAEGRGDMPQAQGHGLLSQHGEENNAHKRQGLAPGPCRIWRPGELGALEEWRQYRQDEEVGDKKYQTGTSAATAERDMMRRVTTLVPAAMNAATKTIAAAMGRGKYSAPLSPWPPLGRAAWSWATSTQPRTERPAAAPCTHLKGSLKNQAPRSAASTGFTL
eukprot:CAMPEP_0180514992 /NCGR_PEP_ID=MMETSP1036_2-20121128/53060_1 /TAXON_ID=632150 /ORGANISM="Azadinium spinosum, Strain 3D9" /LENGTH=287 /DNA_ID=CAMNT_0022526521 /DNA_START=16 /DNA_END=879 /DNA_ORIENTATION=+